MLRMYSIVIDARFAINLLQCLFSTALVRHRRNPIGQTAPPVGLASSSAIESGYKTEGSPQTFLT